MPSPEQNQKVTLQDILSCPSFLAVGIEPQKGEVHIAIKSALGMQHYVRPLDQEIMVALNLLKRVL